MMNVDEQASGSACKQMDDVARVELDNSQADVKVAERMAVSAQAQAIKFGYEQSQSLAPIRANGHHDRRKER